MGKEWLYHWGGRGGSSSSSSSSCTGGRSRKNTFSCSSGGDSGSVVGNSTTSTPSSGCINAVVQLFNFNHPFHFSNNLHPQSHETNTFFPQEPTTHDVPLKGAEAPRNSLDIHDETNFTEPATLSSSNLKNDETLHIKNGMQIKTSGHTRSSVKRFDDNSSLTSNSPGGTKTPTLVARLMGLDLLPDTSSPRSSSSSTINHSSSNSQPLQNLALKKKKATTASSFANANDHFISHSLPVTPRTSSSSSARRSDIDQRFSLQINNDVASCQEIEFSKFLKSKINAARMHEDENMSPGHYAKQIVKQFKESVIRRVGKDITNTVTNHDYQRRDQNVVLLKPKKPSNLGNGSEASANKSLRSKAQNSVLLLTEEKEKQKSSLRKSKQVVHGDGNMKCSSKFKKPPQTLDLMRSKQEEPFVKAALTNARASQHSDNKCKGTPLPNLLSLKKKEMKRQKQFYDSEASDPKSKKKTQLLSCNLSQSYKQDRNDQNSFMGAEQLTHYISGILYCTGIFHYTPISVFKFNSPSHPLHPSIFYQLPKLPNGKLIFELVDQLLAEILQPHFGYNSSFILSKKFMFEELKCCTHCTKLGYQQIAKNVPMYGEQLLHILSMKIKNFRSVNCLVLEDIDALIDKDLPPKLLECEGEVEGIVMEIEGYILERLVHETFITLVDCAVGIE